MLKTFEESLKTDIVNAWYPKLIDEENGGYNTCFDRKMNVVSPFPKEIITQARSLWTAAKAAKRYPEDKMLRKAADHGFTYLRDMAWDKEYGGFFQDISGESHELKTAYGNAFSIYALAAYYELSQDEEALELAKKTFHWLDENCHDERHKGYYNTMLRNGTCAEDTAGFNSGKPDQHIFFMEFAKYKDYNSTIHLMEGFTELYRVWPDETLKARLTELVHVIRDIMVHDKGYLLMHFNGDWTHVTLRDSSRSHILENSWFDHVTFGHDVETAFLLLETEKIIYGNYTERTYIIAKKMIDHAIAYGFDDEYAGIFYEGYYFDEDGPAEIINKDKEWWVQAEGLNALLMISYLAENGDHYREVFEKLWEYTNRYVIDHKYGGWYRRGIDTQERANKNALKGDKWKNCYHTYRAMSQCVDMLKHNKTIFEIHN
ncbi:MAG: AGE family epimerase/isomerase [Bacteroidota bacterium]